MTLNSSPDVLSALGHVLRLSIHSVCYSYISFSPDKICRFLISEVNMDFPFSPLQPSKKNNNKRQKEKVNKPRAFFPPNWFYFLESPWVSLLLNELKVLAWYLGLLQSPETYLVTVRLRPLSVPYAPSKLSHLLILIQACDFSLFFLTAFPSPPWSLPSILFTMQNL